MFLRLFNHFKRFDWVVFGSVILLVAFGLAVIYSVALGSGEASLLNFKKQLIFAAVGIILLLLVSLVDFHSLYGLNAWIYAAGILSLVLVLFLGEPVRGTRAWFEFFGFSLQPSEIVKVIIVLSLAKYFSAASYKINPLKHLISTSLIVIAPVALILWQPDFGSAMIIFIFWLAILAIFGLSRKQIALIALITFLFFALSFFFLLKDYQKERILTFLNFNISSLDKGYNVAQAIIAVGAGQMFGRGLGRGSQSQLKFLPERQTDFIFASLVEELGAVSGMAVVGLYSQLIIGMVLSALKTKDKPVFLVVAGCGMWFFFQAGINIAMNMGMAPVTGITLPFLSAGGSSLVVSAAALGMVLSADKFA